MCVIQHKHIFMIYKSLLENVGICGAITASLSAMFMGLPRRFSCALDESTTAPRDSVASRNCPRPAVLDRPKLLLCNERSARRLFIQENQL